MDEVLQASRTTAMPVHGVVDSVHWGTRLSDPNPEVREKGRLALEGAIRDSKAYGGSSVLLVPGVAHKNDTENHDHVWQRSIEQIRIALPLAAKLGIHILIENVWNNFLYDPDGDNDQSPDKAIAYIDEINSPWVGIYFDIGNIQRYGNPAKWIRALGHRITKLDVKDWGKENGFCKIGEGDVDWAQVRQALRDINYTGWATAEVGGGDENRLAEILVNMHKTLRI
jgi:hexulose-6-phosphate isomerase